MPSPSSGVLRRTRALDRPASHRPRCHGTCELSPRHVAYTFGGDACAPRFPECRFGPRGPVCLRDSGAVAPSAPWREARVAPARAHGGCPPSTAAVWRGDAGESIAFADRTKHTRPVRAEPVEAPFFLATGQGRAALRQAQDDWQIWCV